MEWPAFCQKYLKKKNITDFTINLDPKFDDQCSVTRVLWKINILKNIAADGDRNLHSIDWVEVFWCPDKCNFHILQTKSGHTWFLINISEW